MYNEEEEDKANEEEKDKRSRKRRRITRTTRRRRTSTTRTMLRVCSQSNASLHGSHGLSARRARMTKSRRPEGPQTRSWGLEGP